MHHSVKPVVKLEGASNSTGGLVKTQLASPTPRLSESAGLGLGGQRICISNQFPGDVYTPDPKTNTVP